jgi:hypothetical protein
MARSKPKPFKRQALFRFFVLDKAPIKHTVTIIINAWLQVIVNVHCHIEEVEMEHTYETCKACGQRVNTHSTHVVEDEREEQG